MSSPSFQPDTIPARSRPEAAGPSAEYPSAELDLDLADYMFGVQARVGARLEGVIAEAGPSFHDIYQYVFEGAAKRLRPALVYATGDAFGVPRDQLDDYAVVCEMSHTASLIVDDFQDGSTERRHRPAAYIEFGTNLALMGAFAMVFDTNERSAGIDAEAGLGGELSKYVSQSLGKDGMCRGQAEDITTFGQDPSEVTIEEEDRTTHRKTGLAIEMSVVGAARIGGMPGDQIYHLRQYSYHAGIVHQIKNDFLDVLPAANASTGAPNRDAANRKPNYVSVLGTENAEAKLRDHQAEAGAALNHLSPDANPVKLKELVDYIANHDR